MFKNKNKETLVILVITIILFYSVIYYFLLSQETKHFEQNNVEQKGQYKKLITSIYYSITTLTTIGLGEIYPVTSLAQIITASETIFVFLIISEFSNF